ncbi:MAG: hypothetical protein HC872_05210 [Gammaproteobacteria bacterium]|nr:hypothetical protein [Gammaproteobacteria bacterium]
MLATVPGIWWLTILLMFVALNLIVIGFASPNPVSNLTGRFGSGGAVGALLMLLTTLRKRKMMLIGTGLPKNADGVEFEIPVRIWRSAVLNNADGTGPRGTADEVPQFRAENSRIISGVAENIAAVVVMVDTTQTGTATFSQLADFVAMMSLARIDLNENLADATTILGLFTPSVAAALPAGLTDWDRAFLKGLYESRDALVHQRSQIAKSMARDLVP